MQNTVVPLFVTHDLVPTLKFYTGHLGFRPKVELPGYAEIQQGEDGPLLGFMEADGQRWKAASGQGLIYCFCVADADAEHERLVSEGVKILEAPEDKPWGERAFLAVDPNGISLYFGHPLPESVDAAPAER